MRRRHLESVSAAPYGRCFRIVRIQPQLSGKGVLGHSPKCVLPTFAHTKVGPRRAGVQAVTLRRLRYADRRPQTIPCRVGIQILISKRPRPAARRLQIRPTGPAYRLCHTKGSPNLSVGGALFLSLIYTARALHRWCAGYGAPGGCPARPNTPRTAPSPRGSRGSCAGSWPHLRYTGPPRARNADR